MATKCLFEKRGLRDKKKLRFRDTRIFPEWERESKEGGKKPETFWHVRFISGCCCCLYLQIPCVSLGRRLRPRQVIMMPFQQQVNFLRHRVPHTTLEMDFFTGLKSFISPTFLVIYWRKKWIHAFSKYIRTMWTQTIRIRVWTNFG